VRGGRRASSPRAEQRQKKAPNPSCSREIRARTGSSRSCEIRESIAIGVRLVLYQAAEKA
jgi:hypothetical protein